MPDNFGFMTPQEASQAIRQRFQESIARQRQSQTPGARVGAALSQLFAPTVRKALDTREARKDLARRLHNEQGLSMEEARAQAAIEIEPEFAQVRRAKRLQDASKEIDQLVTDVAPKIGPEKARAVGMLHMAQRLKGLGMNTEAAQLSTQAAALMREAETQELERRKLKANVRQEEIGVDQAQATLDDTGQTEFTRTQNQRNLAEGRLRLAREEGDEEMADFYARQAGELDARLAKLNAVVGRSQFDIALDPTFLRKQMTDHFDDVMMLEQLDLAEQALLDTSNFESSFLGTLDARRIAFFERYLNIDPSLDEKERLARITTKEARPTLVAAQVRHALTGAQMSHFEIQYLEPFLPSPDDSRSRMLAKLNALRQYTQMDMETRMGLLATPGLTEAFFTRGGVTMRSTISNPGPADKPRTIETESGTIHLDDVSVAPDGG